LEVVPHARDVRRHLDVVGQPDPGHLAEGRIRLLGGRGEHPDADAPLLRRALQGRTVGLALELFPAHADELTYRRQLASMSCIRTTFRVYPSGSIRVNT